ncbi:hypothetical protein SteCoe_19365 [Stentor coeruleus]|uniref:Uncharacterized protein n=1 Tax=Stentor coeruleus TaxID=5963 RepID=A0A1R2BU77_9CILI|nr:hypothetical protein SteCoe_19365 [Stentor coeruleus]
MEVRNKILNMPVNQDTHNIPYSFPQKPSINTILSTLKSQNPNEKSVIEEETTYFTKKIFTTIDSDASEDYKRKLILQDYSQDALGSLSLDFEYRSQTEMFEDTKGVVNTMDKMKSQISLLSTRLIKYKDVIRSLDAENNTLRHRKIDLKDKIKNKVEMMNQNKSCFKWCI